VGQTRVCPEQSIQVCDKNKFGLSALNSWCHTPCGFLHLWLNSSVQPLQNLQICKKILAYPQNFLKRPDGRTCHTDVCRAVRGCVPVQPWQISSKHTMMRWLLGARTDRAQIERDLMEMTTTDDSDATDD
jgi:hypothetical protein